MIKISRLADYAVVVLGTLANAGDEQFTASALAEKSTLPEPTVSKVLKLLAKDDLVSSTRGVNGGYKLEKSADEISVASIVSAVDGPIALTACVIEDTDNCGYACSCPVKGGWGKVNDAIRGALEDVTLKDMLGYNALYSKDEVA